MKVNVLEVSLGRQSSQGGRAFPSWPEMREWEGPDLVYQHITPPLPPVHSSATRSWWSDNLPVITCYLLVRLCPFICNPHQNSLCLLGSLVVAQGVWEQGGGWWLVLRVRRDWYCLAVMALQPLLTGVTPHSWNCVRRCSNLVSSQARTFNFRLSRHYKHQTTMYIRSSSEPPEQGEDQLKNGLRGGFPIKINGYALGSQENINEVGREGSSDRTDIFGPRVRSRQNSVSRQSSVSRNLDCDQQEDGLYSSTPFGPLQGRVNFII